MFAYCHQSMDVVSFIFLSWPFIFRMDPCYKSRSGSNISTTVSTCQDFFIRDSCIRGHFSHLEPSVLADKVATTFLTHVSCAVSEHPRVPSAQVACWVITGCTSSTQAETAKLLSNTGVPLPHVQNRTQSPVTTRFYHTRLSKTYWFSSHQY